MKKIIPFFILLIGISCFAQERTERRSEMSNEEMATVRAKRLAMQLDLTQEQQEELKGLFTKRIEDRRESIQERREDKKEDRKEVAEERDQQENKEKFDEYKTEMKEILTEEQFAKWEQLQEKRRKGRKVDMKQ